MTRALALTCALALAATAACGTSEEPGGADGRGPITLTDTQSHEEATRKVIDAWNAAHPDEKVTLDIQPKDADSQRQRLINNAQTKSDAMDVMMLDAVWTAEFAANRWIDPVPDGTLKTEEFLAPTLETARYRGKLYATPWLTGTGLLYYRKDLLSEAPKTWAELKKSCDQVLPKQQGMSCYAGLLDKYEGLTVSFSEAVQSAGGTVVDASGNPTLNTDAAKAGLSFLVDGFKSGLIPKEGITFKEEEVKNALQSGKVLFARSWASLYGTANAPDSPLAGKVDVAPIPGLDGLGSGTLGGANLAISAFSKNKATAKDFLAFFTSAEQMKIWATINSTPVSRTALYDDQELVAKYPYLPSLKEGVLAAKPRPVAVKYGDVTAAIQNAVYPALSGEVAVDQALAGLQQQLSGLLKQ
ncbi:ABC transporter substrate-binding protein [Nonomuraea sp. PA05]|uniref:ABC transporter substrate-binding protein n=1 Tax=Nonomuraea sp. PA05 TaxID=2604466 RepID=UPI0011D9D9CB|nr:ABC transporter substrate-binding protein [Nonomuraea sp. PA05]TYB57245.1 ABC transporter substrate-binding protein [Nonomuraea sp. PA05]